jgi:hypothetical protein
MESPYGARPKPKADGFLEHAANAFELEDLQVRVQRLEQNREHLCLERIRGLDDDAWRKEER